MRATFVILLALLAGCGEFELRSVVIDLRVLAMTVDPPEILLDSDTTEISLDDIEDVEVCALVADPSRTSALTWTLTACPPTDSRRCDEEPDSPSFVVDSGVVEDPESAATPTRLCATLRATPSLLEVVVESARSDPLQGFSGIGVQLELELAAEDDPDSLIYAAKQMYYGARIPEEREPNLNPSLQSVTGFREATGIRDREVTIPLGRCLDVTPVTVAVGEQLGLLPDEAEGARQDYVVPTFDGGSREFTENLTYSWYASAGEWSREVSGGPRDFADNDPPLDSTWTAPDDLEEIGAGLNIEMWLIQQDERGGVAWYQTCARVEP